MTAAPAVDASRILRRPLDVPSNWRGAELAGSEDWT